MLAKSLVLQFSSGSGGDSVRNLDKVCAERPRLCFRVGSSLVSSVGDTLKKDYVLVIK